MNEYYQFLDNPFEDETQELPHLPLDWNEEISLEEYLERVEKNSQKILNS